MKKSVLIVVAVVCLVSVVAIRANVTAQDDAVPVLQTQVADLEARVSALEGTTVPAAASTPVLGNAESGYFFSGTGQSVVKPVLLHDGPYTVTMTCSTTGGWIALFDEGGAKDMFFSGQKIHTLYAGTYLLDVRCDGNWSLTIEPLST